MIVVESDYRGSFCAEELDNSRSIDSSAVDKVKFGVLCMRL